MLKKILALLCGILTMFALVAFKENNEDERSFLTVELPEEKTVVNIVDINSYGWLKYYLNPNVRTIYIRIKDKDKQRAISYDFIGMQAEISQGSKKGIWKQLTPGQILTKNAKGEIPLTLELSFPKSEIENRQITQGKLLFYNNKKVLSEVQIQIINSKFKD